MSSFDSSKPLPMILKFRNEAFSRQLPGSYSSKTPLNQMFKSKDVFLKNNALSLDTKLVSTPSQMNFKSHPGLLNSSG